jgi:hypothetical protein
MRTKTILGYILRKSSWATKLVLSDTKGYVKICQRVREGEREGRREGGRQRDRKREG